MKTTAAKVGTLQSCPKPVPTGLFSADYRFTLYNDVAEFSMFKFPLRASTYKVISGGWALYSEPNFQGKVMFQFGSEF